MKRYGLLAGFLMLPVTPLFATPPFEIGGLHVHLGFEEAVSRAEALGGICQLGTLNRGAVLTAQCEYTACSARGSESPCDETAQDTSLFSEIGQPVPTIGLEANAGATRLTRISFVYAGNSEAVKTSLVNSFGPPAADDSEYSGTTWTHGRRMHWRSGADSMGLLMTTRVVTLSSTAPGPETGSAAGL